MMTVIPVIVGILEKIKKKKDLEKRLRKLEIFGRFETICLNTEKSPVEQKILAGE